MRLYYWVGWDLGELRTMMFLMVLAFAYNIGKEKLPNQMFWVFAIVDKKKDDKKEGKNNCFLPCSTRRAISFCKRKLVGSNFHWAIDSYL